MKRFWKKDWEVSWEIGMISAGMSSNVWCRRWRRPTRGWLLTPCSKHNNNWTMNTECVRHSCLVITTPFWKMTFIFVHVYVCMQLVTPLNTMTKPLCRLYCIVLLNLPLTYHLLPYLFITADYLFICINAPLIRERFSVRCVKAW